MVSLFPEVNVYVETWIPVQKDDLAEYSVLFFLNDLVYFQPVLPQPAYCSPDWVQEPETRGRHEAEIPVQT